MPTFHQHDGRGADAESNQLSRSSFVFCEAPAPCTPCSLPDWRRSLLLAAGLSILTLALFVALATFGTPVAAAQSQPALGLAISKTLAGSNLVHLGQPLTFTIRITNTGTISVVKLPLLDDYDSTIIAIDHAAPAFSAQPAPGQLVWNDLIPLFPSLGGALQPGQSIAVVTYFRTVRANVATVNKARIGDAVGWGGKVHGGGGNQGQAGTRGGRVIVKKAPAPGVVPQIGQPITFTISVLNDGAADVTKLPLEDTFMPDVLQFSAAKPAPNQVDPAGGKLRWDDVLPGLGRTRLRPNETITVTTVFTALKAIDGKVVNSVGANGVRDEYGNAIDAPRQTEIPIRIVAPGQPTPESTPTPSHKSRSKSQDTPTPEQATPTVEQVTPTAMITATPVITATAAVSSTVAITATAAVETGGAQQATPASLPRTAADDGPGGGNSGGLLLGVGLLACGVLALLLRRRERRP
jgi:uncharacterized repeat protein (TIGR01451 family)